MGADDAYLVVSGHHKTACPVLHGLGSHDCPHTPDDRLHAGLLHSQQQDTSVGARPESTDIREMKILGDEEPPASLCCSPDLGIFTTPEPLLGHGIHIVPLGDEDRSQASRQVLIDLRRRYTIT